MDSLNRIFNSINEAKKAKAKSKKGMVGETPKGAANRYDHDSFGMKAESSHMGKKKKKKLIGNQHKLDQDKDGTLTKKDFKMLRGESSEIVTVLSILKEAYQDELISEEAFLAIADPIMRSLMEVTFPDTFQKEDLDDAEEEDAKAKSNGPKRVKKGPKPKPPSGTAGDRRKERHADASDKRSMNPGK
jgi:hypothetical protein